jgi:hypothetical protein
MKPIHSIGILSATLLALIALTPATATAALPEFEFTRSFASGSMEPVVIENTEGVKVNCTESENESGTFEAGAGKLAKNIVLKFKKCKKGATACTTTGAGTEVILTKALEGVLGYLEGGKRGDESVIIALRAETPPIAEFRCGTENVDLIECIAGTIVRAGNPGELTKQFSLSFEQTGGTQKYDTYESTLGGGLTLCRLRIEVAPASAVGGLSMKQTVLICPGMEKIND